MWVRRCREHIADAEEGGALLIALLAVTVMLFVGMVLFEVLGASLNLGARTQARIQAELLSQKGLDEALVRIRSVADDDEILNKDSELIKIEDFLVTGSSNVRGEYTVQIDQDIIPALTTYVRKFDITSTGKIERGKGITVSKKMTVYVSNINPVFRYPLSARGNLQLNGAPTIIGDVLVREGEVVSSKNAYFVDQVDSLYHFQSDHASILGFIKAKDIKKQNLTDIFSQNIPFIDEMMEDDQDIDIEGVVREKINALEKLNNDGNYAVSPAVDFEYQLGNGNTFSGSKKLDSSSAFVNGNYTIDGDLLVVDGSLYFEGTDPKLQINHGSLYISNPPKYLVAADLRGELKVESEQSVVVDGNVVINEGFLFPSGKMYINGDLRIIGNVNLTGTIFVNGNVELNEMKSVNSDDMKQKSPLIIMSSGKIILGNNVNERADIRAFLYSKAPITLYGVNSKLAIYGGIHGESSDLTNVGVELNAVRGNINSNSATEEAINDHNDQMISNLRIQDEQDKLTPEQSRLQIRFDPNLYENPPEGIPTIDGLDVFVQNISFIK